MSSPDDECRFPPVSGATLRVGVDTVHVPRIADSLSRLGTRFEQRLFTDAERAYADLATVPRVKAERLAARFAAKEATIKALNLPEAGVSWQDIEVRREASGACELTLRGVAARRARELNVVDLALSLSHDGDQAIAMVVCRLGA